MSNGERGFIMRYGKQKRIAVIWLLLVSLLWGAVIPSVGYANGIRNEVALRDALASAISGIQPVAASDMQGHWAEKQLTDWMNRALISGYPDGTVRPNTAISRVEFVALVNRLFSYAEGKEVAYADVSTEAWYAKDVKAAAAAGFVSGYPDGTFQPNKPLSRVEAVAMLAKLVPMIAQEGVDPLAGFTDQGTVPAYGRDSLGIAIQWGYVKGYPDHTVRPFASLTRAEAVALLDPILQQAKPNAEGGREAPALTLHAAGTYGPSTGSFAVAGDLHVDAPGTVLRNVVVKGDLAVGQSVGDGDVFFDHVTVLGTTTISGGGEHSVHVDDSNMNEVYINRKDGRVRVVVNGTTAIDQMIVESDASIESGSSTGSGIEGISISAGGDVTLSGDFSHVSVESGARITVASGTIGQMIVIEGSGASTITLGEGVQVGEMELHGTAIIQGEGEIGKAIVDSPNVTFEKEPGSVEVTDRGSVLTGTVNGTGGTGGTVTPPSNPPIDPNPDVDPDVSVTVIAGEASITGFKLTFSSAVPNLTGSAVLLRNAMQVTVPVTSVSTLNDGNSYRIAAALQEGETYTVSLAKTGYAFGAAVTFTVPVTPPPPIAVTVSAQAIGPAGFTLTFSPPVVGLDPSNFTLKKSGTNEPVSVTGAVYSADAVAAYQLSAALIEDSDYTVTVTKQGYLFGDPIAIYVPVTDPQIVQVAATVSGIGAAGFTVALSPSVAGLTADDFGLTDPLGASAPIAAVTTDNDGATYTITAALVEGISYTLAIDKEGYSFGATQQVDVTGGSGPDPDIVVVPSANNVTSAGFILTLDQSIPDLDALNFVLHDGAQEPVSIDYLSTVDLGTRYEIWTSLEKNDTYTLSLDKPGYTFDAPVQLHVAAQQVASTIDWVTHRQFQLRLDRGIGELTAAQVALQHAEGDPVAIDSVQLAADGRSAIITADLSAAGQYAYHVDIDYDHYTEGAVAVPEIIAVSKYTTFNGSFGAHTGLTVHLATPVPGLTADAFTLTNGSGSPMVPDAVTTSDNGANYTLQVALPSADSPFKLNMEAAGYQFGSAATLVSATINRWSTPGVLSPQFMAGLNPKVPNLTVSNFSAVDQTGHAVAITDVSFNSSMQLYIVTFDGVPGHTYTITVQADGYDFGAPRTIEVYPINQVVDISSGGFTLALRPAVAINTQYGFTLKKQDGSTVAIQSAVTNDNGSSYQIAAGLTPGLYTLYVSAAIEQKSYTFVVPTVATISVDQVTSGGLTVRLNHPIDGLYGWQFVLVNTETGVDLTSNMYVETSDQGASYRFSGNLPGGSYNVKLTDHMPQDGVDFEVPDTVHIPVIEVSNVRGTGFDLAFGGHALPGLQPENIVILDSMYVPLNVQVSSLVTNDNGVTYHVYVTLPREADYVVSMQKEFVNFGMSPSIRVGKLVTATVTDVTSDGHLVLQLSAASPEIEGALITALTGSDGQVYYPATLSSADGGKSFQIYYGNPDYKLQPGITYTFKVDEDAIQMTPVSFLIPSDITVTDATTSGLQLHFASPIPGLLKKNFIVRSSGGEVVSMISVASSEDGGTYSLAGTLTSGRRYTIQYVPNAAGQSTTPVAFVVPKFVTATISGASAQGFKVKFGSAIADLTAEQIDLRDSVGDRIPYDQYAVSTSDQGLTYQVTTLSQYVLRTGASYALDLVRDEFKLASPIALGLAEVGSVRLILADSDQIGIQVYPYPGLPDYPDLTSLTADNFALYDPNGSRLAIIATDLGNGVYKLERSSGSFDNTVSYTLATSAPGFDFGEPIKVGFNLTIGVSVMKQSQSGYKLNMYKTVPGLDESSFVITDDQGQPVTVQSVTTTDGGVHYDVRASLTSGHVYSLAITKEHYSFILTPLPPLTGMQAEVDGLSLNGFRLSLSSPLQLLFDDLTLLDDQGQPVRITHAISHDKLNYQIDVPLQANVTYTLQINANGYDFGPDIPLVVHSVSTTFEGVDSGNSRAFTIRFDQAVPDLGPNDFQVRQFGVSKLVSILQATTENGGFTYTIEASFNGSDRYTVLPVKDGYNFGSAIDFIVPVVVSAAILGTSSNYVDIGFNAEILNLTAGYFSFIDGAGNTIAAEKAEHLKSYIYRITAPFVGGETYTARIEKEGYDFTGLLEAYIPVSIEASSSSLNDSGWTIDLSHAVAGLTADSFTLRDSNGQPVTLSGITDLNDGAQYAVSASLTQGETYTLAISQSGYQFNTTLTGLVPIVVSGVAAEINVQGFNLQFDHAVDGFSVSDFRLLDDQGELVAITAASTSDEGLTYQLKASIAEGRWYLVSMSRSGYDFGSGVNLYVPVTIVPSVEAASTTGFTLRLPEAIIGLTAEDMILQHRNGTAVAVEAMTTTDGGLTYSVSAPLTNGQPYSMSLAADGYDFGLPLQFNVRTMSLTNIDSDKFQVQLSLPIPYMNASQVQLLDEEGQPAAISYVSLPDDLNHEGYLYTINATMTPGQYYTFKVTDPAYPAVPPVQVMFPIEVHPQVTLADGNIIQFALDSAEVDLQQADVALTEWNGDPVNVVNFSPGETAGTYEIQADVIAGRTYTLTINKERYHFGAPLSARMIVHTSATVASVSQNGFNLNLKESVTGVTIQLFDQGVPVSANISAERNYTSYRVQANLDYNKEFTVRISVPHYDFGADLTVNNVALLPELIDAVSNDLGDAITLTFDKPLYSNTVAGAPFSVKLNGSWLSGVVASVPSGAGSEQIVLRWSGSKRITSSSQAFVAYSGVNRVRAQNNTYLAAFGETAVTIMATELGLVQYYAKRYSPDEAVQVLHQQYGETAVGAAKLMQEGGFYPSWLYPAIYTEYGMNNADFYALLYAMDLDANTLREAAFVMRDRLIDPSLAKSDGLLQAGFNVFEIAPVMKDIESWTGTWVPWLNAAVHNHSVSLADGALVLQQIYRMPHKQAIKVFSGIPAIEIAPAIQSVYGLTNGETIAALKGGDVSAPDAANVTKLLYQATAATSYRWLVEAGYQAVDSGAAILRQYDTMTHSELVSILFGAGATATELYGIEQLVGVSDALGKLVDAGIPYREVAAASRAKGDKPQVFIGAMNRRDIAAEEIAAALREAWNTSAGRDELSYVISNFRLMGYAAEAQAKLLRNVFGADIAMTYSVLGSYSDLNILLAMLYAGYDPTAVTTFYMQRERRDRNELFKGLTQSGLSSEQAMKAIRDGIAGNGSSLSIASAVQILESAEGFAAMYRAEESIIVLQSAFPGDDGVSLTPMSIASELSATSWKAKTGIAKAMKDHLGMTMQQWLVIERTIPFGGYLGADVCTCTFDAILSTIMYLYKGSTIQDVILAMSKTGLYSISEVVAGSVSYFKAGSTEAAVPYLMSVLKDSGYSFQDIAAALDQDSGMHDLWLSAFRKYGLSFMDAAVYLKSAGRRADETISQLDLAHYSTEEEVLVLREVYGLDSDAALLEMRNFINPVRSEVDIVSAVGKIYSVDPVLLFAKLLKRGGGSATSILNGVAGKYPAYRQVNKAGPLLVQLGLSQDEVMEALLALSKYFGGDDLKTTIGMLQSMYATKQILIAQLLEAESMTTAATGIPYLKSAGFSMEDIVRALKDYYHLNAGEAAQALKSYYDPDDMSSLMRGLSNLYGQSVSDTLVETLEAKGIETAREAVRFMEEAGYGADEMFEFVRTHFGLNPGQTAAVYKTSAELTGEVAYTLITKLAQTYDESVDSVLHELLVARGVTSYNLDAIRFVNYSYFPLATNILLAKNGYALSAGEATQQLIDSDLYEETDIIVYVREIYGTSQTESIVDGLAAMQLDTFPAAVNFMKSRNYHIYDLIRVGKEYYELSSGDVSLALTGYYGAVELDQAISVIYGQSLTEIQLNALAAGGVQTFAAAIVQMKGNLQFTLEEIVLAAKSYFKVSAGVALHDLLQSQAYSITDIQQAVAEVYGKPINESVADLLKRSGLSSISDAAPLLRSMGYSLEEVVEASKSYYGNSEQATLDALRSITLENADVLKWTVQGIYQSSSAKNDINKTLQSASITGNEPSIAYLWQSGYSLFDIVTWLKTNRFQTAGQTVQLLVANDLFEMSMIVSTIGSVYGNSFDPDLFEAIKSSEGVGNGLPAEQFATLLAISGYRMDVIVQYLKLSYLQTKQEALATLATVGLYSEDAIQSNIEEVYSSSGTSSSTLKQALELYGITTPNAAVAFLAKQIVQMADVENYVKDIAEYLKDVHGLGADETTAMLASHYSAAVIRPAIADVYYSASNLRALRSLVGANSSAFTGPSNFINELNGKISINSIVLALKVLFDLDATEVMDVGLRYNLEPSSLQKAVEAVYDVNPMYAYLKSLKDDGASADQISSALRSLGALSTMSTTEYVDLLLRLGFDTGVVYHARNAWMIEGVRNDSTEVQGKQMVQLGFTTPAAIVAFVFQNSGAPAYKMVQIVKAGLPNASMVDLAYALKSVGYDKDELLGAVKYAAGTMDDNIAAILKDLGFNATQALSYLNDRSTSDRVRWLIRNGYAPIEFIHRVDKSDGTAVAAMREEGISASDIATAIKYYQISGVRFDIIARDLYNGGFTDPVLVAKALVDAGEMPLKVIDDMTTLGKWEIEPVAQALLDADVLSLTDLVTALGYAVDFDKPTTIYFIIKKVSKKQQQSLYDFLGDARGYLPDNDIAIIVTITAMREAGYDAGTMAGILHHREGAEYLMAGLLLGLSGYAVDDLVAEVINEYRTELVIAITIAVLTKAVGAEFAQIPQYYKIIKRVILVVKVTSKVIDKMT